MSYLPTLVPELSVVGLLDAGIPNRERILLRPTQVTQLSAFTLSVGLYEPATGGARPLFDNIFWFPEKLVFPPSWIIVFTAPGQPRDVTLENGEQGHTFFWQRRTTIFNDARLVPVLLRIGGAIVGPRL